MPDENQKLTEVYVPDNVLEGKRYFGFRRRNIIEGLIFAALFAAIIGYIPFVTRIKIIFWVVICGSVFILNCIGIKDKSFTEIVSYIYMNKQVPKIMHMRTIKNAKKRKQINLKQSTKTYTNQSIAEKLLELGKEKYKEFRGN